MNYLHIAQLYINNTINILYLVCVIAEIALQAYVYLGFDLAEHFFLYISVISVNKCGFAIAKCKAQLNTQFLQLPILVL